MCNDIYMIVMVKRRKSKDNWNCLADLDRSYSHNQNTVEMLLLFKYFIVGWFRYHHHHHRRRRGRISDFILSLCVCVCCYWFYFDRLFFFYFGTTMFDLYFFIFFAAPTVVRKCRRLCVCFLDFDILLKWWKKKKPIILNRIWKVIVICQLDKIMSEFIFSFSWVQHFFLSAVVMSSWFVKTGDSLSFVFFFCFSAVIIGR